MKRIRPFYLLLLGIILLAANARAGRWITRDPLDVPQHMQRDPHSWLDLNPFTFVQNNPVNKIDPNGLLTADRYEEIVQGFRLRGVWQNYYASIFDGTPMEDHVDYGGVQSADGDILLLSAAVDGFAAIGDFAWGLGKSGIKAAVKCFAKDAPKAALSPQQAISPAVRQFLNGEIPLSQVPSAEAAQAANYLKDVVAPAARDAADAAYQLARSRSLQGLEPPPGPIIPWRANYGK